MLKVEFNATAARDAVVRAKATLADMTPVYQDIAEYMIEVTRQRFASGTDPDGNAWAPKKPATLERYKRLGYGNLPKTLIGPGKRLSREVVGQASRSGAVIGSALIYSGVMQDGAEQGAFGANKRGRPIPWGRIPARTWLGIGAEDELAIIEIVEEHLGDALET